MRAKRFRRVSTPVLVSLLLGGLVTSIFLLTVLRSTPAGAQSPRFGGTIKIAHGVDVVNLDPAFAIDSVGFAARRHILERLVELDPKTVVPRPGLAESWQVSPDGLTWTFHLRKNVTFHDGTPFDAQAVKFTLERILNPETNAPWKHLLAGLKRIETPDPNTVKLTTAQPAASLLSGLGHAALEISSPTQVRKLGQDYRKHPIGTGPFKFARQGPGLLEFEANLAYWGGRPYLDKIQFVAIPEESVRVAAVEAGDIDVAVQVSPVDVARVEKAGKVNLLRAKGTRAFWIRMNVRAKPFDDVRVRRAMNYAVDMDAILKQVVRGEGSPSDAILTPGFYGYSPILRYEYNPQRAVELLTQAGYPKGFTITLTMSPGRYTMDANVAEAVQAYLRKISVNLEINSIEWASFVSRLKDPTRDKQMNMYYMGWASSSGDPTDGILPVFHTASFPPANYNAAFYSNPRVDTLLDEQARTIDESKRLQLLREAQRIIMEEAPAIFLFNEAQVSAANKRVHGLVIPTTLTIDARRAWRDD